MHTCVVGGFLYVYIYVLQSKVLFLSVVHEEGGVVDSWGW